jgi:hypothetical protein
MSVYEAVTHSVLTELENNTPPWINNWQPHLPHNLVSKREYRGVNVFLLWSRGFTSPYWLTSRQARALGGHIKKGQKPRALSTLRTGSAGLRLSSRQGKVREGWSQSVKNACPVGERLCCTLSGSNRASLSSLPISGRMWEAPAPSPLPPTTAPP